MAGEPSPRVWVRPLGGERRGRVHLDPSWRSALAALLNALTKESLGTICPLLLLLLNLSEEVCELLITSSITGVLLLGLRTLKGVIQNTHEVVGGVLGAACHR